MLTFISTLSKEYLLSSMPNNFVYVHEILENLSMQYAKFKGAKQKKRISSATYSQQAFIRSANENSVDIMLYQPEGVLSAVRDDINPSLKISEGITETYNSRFMGFLDMVAKKRPTIALSAEYSTPYACLEKIIYEHATYFDSNHSCLYALCAEGISVDHFTKWSNNFHSPDHYFDRIEDKHKNLSRYVYIHRESVDRRTQNKLINAMMYLFCVRVSYDEYSDEIIVILPQLKTMPMKDEKHDFEGHYLACGETVFIFNDMSSDVALVSLICSDFMNTSMLAELLKKLQAMRVLVLNPQLNKKPRHGMFRFVQEWFVESADKINKTSIDILALNWSENLVIDSTRVFEESRPWSAYIFNKDGDIIDQYKDTLCRYSNMGLELAFYDSIGYWMLPTFEFVAHLYLTVTSSAEIFKIMDLFKYDEESKLLPCDTGNNICLMNIPNCLRYNTSENRSFSDGLVQALEKEVYCTVCEKQGSRQCVNGDDKPRECDKTRVDYVISSILLDTYYNQSNVDNALYFGNTSRVFDLRGDELKRVTSKMHRGMISRRNLYALRKVHHQLRSTESLRYLNEGDDRDILRFRVPTTVDNANIVFCRTDASTGNIDVEYDRCRVYYLSDCSETTAKYTVSRLVDYKKNRWPVILYYENEQGIMLKFSTFPEDGEYRDPYGKSGDVTGDLVRPGRRNK